MNVCVFVCLCACLYVFEILFVNVFACLRDCLIAGLRACAYLLVCVCLFVMCLCDDVFGCVFVCLCC